MIKLYVAVFFFLEGAFSEVRVYESDAYFASIEACEAAGLEDADALMSRLDDVLVVPMCVEP